MSEKDYESLMVTTTRLRDEFSGEFGVAFGQRAARESRQRLCLRLPFGVREDLLESAHEANEGAEAGSYRGIYLGGLRDVALLELVRSELKERRGGGSSGLVQHRVDPFFDSLPSFQREKEREKTIVKPEVSSFP
jgi:hypothetical protein